MWYPTGVSDALDDHTISQPEGWTLILATTHGSGYLNDFQEITSIP